MSIEITTADSTVLTGIRNALSAASLSGAEGWDSAYTTTNANSAGWDIALNLATESFIRVANVTSTVATNSASWGTGGTSVDLSTLAAASASWNSVYTTTRNNSAGWESVESTVYANSATWSNPASQTVTISSSNVILSACTVTTYLSVGGIIYSSQINTVGTGTPTLSSGSDICLDAVTRVTVSNTPFRIANFTTASRDAITPLYGDMIYNTTTNKFQGYASVGWVDLN
jgi:hypothetical protein